MAFSTLQHISITRIQEPRDWLTLLCQSFSGYMASFRILDVVLLLFLCSLPSIAAVPRISTDLLLGRQMVDLTVPLRNFQVSQPVITPAESANHHGRIYTSVLMQHDFAYSYDMPFVGMPRARINSLVDISADPIGYYTPPPCGFNRVTMNLTVTSAGRQFDRLGIMYLGDIEVFRTSTAEPTVRGIVWTYVKEMEHYNCLWQTDQKIIFDLGNLVNSIYTGIYHATLTATFFTVSEGHPVADIILPISARLSAANQASVFSVPEQTASVEYALPKDVVRAVVSLSACGQSTEEFWYTNVFTTEANTFTQTSGPLYGGTPWREVQLLIDGQLAGVSWPFPVIFSGGPWLSPFCWATEFSMEEN